MDIRIHVYRIRCFINPAKVRRQVSHLFIDQMLLLLVNDIFDIHLDVDFLLPLVNIIVVYKKVLYYSFKVIVFLCFLFLLETVDFK